MRRLVVYPVLILLVGASSPAPARRIFVTNSADDTVSVVDGNLDREVKILPVGRSPLGIAARAQPPLLAVANSRSPYVTLIDPLAIEVLPGTVTVGFGPEDVAFGHDGTRLFVTGYYGRTVTVIDVATRAQVGDSVVFAKTPRRLCPSPDGRLFVLLHDAEGAVAVLEPADARVVATVPVGPFPSDLALTTDGGKLLVASFDADTVTVVDTTSLEPVDTIHVDTGFGLVLHPTRPVLYSILSYENSVLAFDVAARQPLATVAVGEGPTHGAITADGRFLYVVNSDANNLVKLDTESNTPVVRIAVGASPERIAIVETDAAPRRSRVLLAVGAAALLVVAAAAFRRRRSPRRRLGPTVRPA